ncbi:MULTISPECIES: chaplin family protein [unclassified Spirillospora]|uniref:chaplin family protein n=1 Tax=unclassified Spirillospora TaxID=2642701 RepID=UPI003716759F
MIKKLAATGVLGFAVAASALNAAPAHAATFGGHDGHGGHHGHGGHGGHGGGDSWFSDNETSGNGSILGGNQIIAPISVPVNVCGNAVAVIGLASAQCKGGASVEYGD